MEELEDPPSVEELSKAIDSLACGIDLRKEDGIPPEVFEAGMKTALLHHLPAPAPYTVLGRRTVPLEGLYANIIIQLAKMITATARTSVEFLSSVSWGRPSPVWCSTDCSRLLNAYTLRHSAGSELEDQQSNDMTFSVRQFQEKCREQRRLLYVHRLH